MPSIVSFKEKEAASEQQCGAKNQDADQRDEIRAERADCSSGRIWASIVIVFRMLVVVMCSTDRERSIHVGIGADDDRQPAMIDAWHISRGPDEPQR